MFSVDAILQDLVPHRQTPSWQRSLLRALLFEREMQQFAERYPHLKGLDLVEQILDYFNFSCEMVEGDLENIPSQGPVVSYAHFWCTGFRGEWRILLIDFVDDFNNREMIPHEKVYPTGLRRTRYCR